MFEQIYWFQWEFKANHYNKIWSGDIFINSFILFSLNSGCKKNIYRSRGTGFSKYMTLKYF